jgi:predicted membrane channel-forming protein YqfA (hemolysin III family)
MSPSVRELTITTFGAGNMIQQTIILVVIAALAMWGVLKWIAKTPSLLTNVKACRGNWAEARIRKCDQGIGVTGIPVEPINAFTNPAYLAAGWVTFRVIEGAPSWIFLGAMTLLFLGSTLYHGTKAMWAARLDHAGMYAVFAALAYYAMAPQHTAIVYVMAVAAIAAAVAFGFVFPGNLSLRMALLLTLVSVRAFLLGSPELAGLSLGLMAVAMGAWLVDSKSLVLGRWGHGIWHVATAVALAAMFMAVTT